MFWSTKINIFKSMKVTITREPNFREHEYCVLEFKGKFETDDMPTRSLVHLGTLNLVG